MTRARDVANVLSTATSLATDTETAAAISSHNSATTSVHGITNTATLATQTYADSAVSTHAAASDPHTGYVLESLVDAKGDLLVGTSDNLISRLAVGATNGHVLQVDSSAATGLSWTAPAGGSSTWTLLASGTLSSTSVNVSSVNAAEILISLPNFVQSSSSKPEIRFNNNSTSGDYGVQYHENNTGVFVWGSGTSGKGFVYVNGANTTASVKFGLANLYPSYVKIASALTSIQIVAGGGGTWSSGTYEVWTR